MSRRDLVETLLGVLQPSRHHVSLGSLERAKGNEPRRRRLKAVPKEKSRERRRHGQQIGFPHVRQGRSMDERVHSGPALQHDARGHEKEVDPWRTDLGMWPVEEKSSVFCNEDLIRA